jgi:hypothetical protein
MAVSVAPPPNRRHGIQASAKHRSFGGYRSLISGKKEKELERENKEIHFSFRHFFRFLEIRWES